MSYPNSDRILSGSTVKARLFFAAASLLLSGSVYAGAPLCNSAAFTVTWVGKDAACGTMNWTCALGQQFYCGDGSGASEPFCLLFTDNGQCARIDCPGSGGDSCDGYDNSAAQCGGPPGGAEVCGDNLDNNADGCIDEGCTIGEPPCECTADCEQRTCGPAQTASCSANNGQSEICGDGADNNCNGLVDEGCAQKKDDDHGNGGSSCDEGGTAGDDPLLLASRSAVTAPFTDFSVDTGLVRLEVTRSYSSNDWSYYVESGPGGSLQSQGLVGLGWHHDWEGILSYNGSDKCTIIRGLFSGYQFKAAGTAQSPDGAETWQIYRPFSNDVLSDDHHNILVRRPVGTFGLWIVFLSDGSEMHYESQCEHPSVILEPYCNRPDLYNQHRLVKTVNERGNVVNLAYGQNGAGLELSDDLGHSLQFVSAPVATGLRYDGMTVATYSYENDVTLTKAEDADGNTLRSYAYEPVHGRLLAVGNSTGDTIASFSYNSATDRATGVIDQRSSVSVDYDAPGGIAVTEYYGNTSSTSVRTLDQDGNVTSISDGCACGSARTNQWTNRRLTCSMDAQGHVLRQYFDELGRLTRRIEYAGTSCSPPSTLPADARDERYSYGLVKPIAQGVNLDLARVTSVTRPSTLNPQVLVGETYDYDQAPNASLDPAGYSCASTPLPVGSVVCRQISTGNGLTASGGVQLERHATFFSYDSRGRLVRTHGPVNLDNPSASDVVPVEERTYWSETESLARRGRLHELKRYPSPAVSPLVTRYDYDAFGPFQITQPNGAITTIVKDGRGRPTFVITTEGTRETRYYDGLSPRLQILPSGAAIRYSYDSMGRLRLVEHLSGDPEAPGSTALVAWSESYTYDAAGNRFHSERRDGQGTVTWQQDRSFDVQHRQVSDTNPESPATARANTFDPSGFLAAMADEQGRTTTYTPDGINRVKKVTSAGLTAAGLPVSLDVAQYTYQPYADTLSQVVSGNGLSTSYQYDDFGRLARLASSSFKGGQVSFSYDARGNLLQRKDNYVTVRYTYDGLDRLLTVNAENSADGASVAYTYVYDEPGGVGQLTSVVEPERVVHYSYSATGRLTSETIQENGVTEPLVTQYQYDADGAVSDIIYPSGLHVSLVRDPATREVVQVNNAAGGTHYASQVTHLPGGPVKGLVFGNGLTLTQTFNRRYEPQTIVSGPLSLGYSMTPAGDVSAIADTSTVLSGCQRNTSRSFGYDFLDRLVESPSWLEYGYDGAGNRIAEIVENVPATFIYDPSSDRVQDRRMSGKRTHAYGYDYQTNLSAIGVYNASGSSVTSAVCFRHDPLGRMVLFGNTNAASVSPDSTSCTDDSAVTQAKARFRYDARNRRVARQDAASGQWTYVVSDAAGNPLSELALVNGAWTKQRDYVWLDGRPLAQIEYPGPSGSEQGYVYYYHLDQIGLARSLTNANGQLIWNTYAKPYGDIAEKTSTDPLSGQVVVTNLRLPGQYDERLLTPLGLQGPYYNWNRWYLPGVGRYLELDPLASVGWLNGDYGPDWYNYANKNPLRYVDRDGRLWAPPVTTPWWTTVGPCVGRVIGPIIPLLWPNSTGGDPCENSPEGCVTTPQSKLVTCKFLSAGGKGPAPGATQRCTYTCSNGTKEWQVERRYVECPDEITVNDQ